MKNLAAILLIAFLSCGFYRGTVSGATPVLTAATLYASSPAVNNAQLTLNGAAASIASSAALTSCNITAGDPSGNFTCTPSGSTAVISVTSAGAANLTNSDPTTSSSQSLTVTGTNASGTSPGVTVNVSVFADGSPNAPTGTSPTGLVAFGPSLLSGYVTRAPWPVAGVDYRVGIHNGVSLADAKTIPGIGIVGNKLTLSTANQTINGFDFSLNGGYQLDVNASGVHFINCKFAIGANNFYMFKQATSAANVIVEYSEFYDNYNAELGSAPNNNGSIVFQTGNGSLFQYNYMEHAFADFFDVYSGGSATIKWNVVHNSGAGGHPDWIALGGGTYTTQTVAFNLFYNQALGADGGGLPSQGTQGIGLDGFGTCTLNGPFSVINNSVVTLPSASMNLIFGWPGAACTRGGGFAEVINTNYVDPRGSASVFSGTQLPGGSKSGNINMFTGGAIP